MCFEGVGYGSRGYRCRAAEYLAMMERSMMGLSTRTNTKSSASRGVTFESRLSHV